VPKQIRVCAQLDTGSFVTGFMPEVFRALVSPAAKPALNSFLIGACFPAIEHLNSVQVFVPKTLEVGPFGSILLRTPSTKRGEPCEADQFDVSVTLMSGETSFSFPSVHAIASDDFDPAEEGVQAIIGRDILNRCVLHYNGPERRFQLEFDTA